MVGHGGDHGGLASARRAVEEVPALPRLAGTPVEVPAVPERVEVVHDRLLLGRLHGQRLERVRVVEVDVAPWFAHVATVEARTKSRTASVSYRVVHDQIVINPEKKIKKSL